MAVFDPKEQRVCVRVVYDGAAGAGKTTNVRQLGSLFFAQRRMEVSSFAELAGRTLYFDWMQIAAGAVCGFPLICQVVTVPGQTALSARRRELLSTADVVVLVCDSSAEEHDLAPVTLDVPVVVQANKQDRAGARDGRALATSIGHPAAPVVEAIAMEGIGVVDTFVAAVRAAARVIQSQVESGRLSLPVREVEREDDLLRRLAGIPLDRDGAAELLLEEASAVFPIAGAAIPLGVELTSDPLIREAEEADVEPTSTIEALRAPLPRDDVPTGFVWPAHTGRSLLHELALESEVLVGAREVSHEVLRHVLVTSPASRFAEHESARQALVRAARERTQLDTLLVPNTVLVVQPASDGSSWLWMVRPRTDDVGAWLGASPKERTEVLGTAIAEAVRVSVRHALSLVPALAAFGVQGGVVRYVARLEASDAPSLAALDLLFGVLDDVIARGLDGELFVDAVARRLDGRLRGHELAMLLRDCPTGDQTRVKERLIRALRGVSEAA